MITREEFCEHWEKVRPGLGKWNSPLWVPETIPPKVKCQWFVCVKPLWGDSATEKEYWDWCETRLSGKVLCYSSSGRETEVQEEWWGFTDEKDVLFWLLRWAT